jgi:hypothetical protein
MALRGNGGSVLKPPLPRDLGLPQPSQTGPPISVTQQISGSVIADDLGLRQQIIMYSRAKQLANAGSGTVVAMPVNSTRNPLGVLPGSVTWKSRVFNPGTKPVFTVYEEKTLKPANGVAIPVEAPFKKTLQVLSEAMWRLRVAELAMNPVRLNVVRKVYVPVGLHSPMKSETPIQREFGPS